MRPPHTTRLSLTSVGFLGLVVATLGTPAGVSAAHLSSNTAHVVVAQSTDRLNPGDQGWITGTAVGRDGQPVVGALVNAVGPREVPENGLFKDQTSRRTWTDEHGAFRVRQAHLGYLLQLCEPRTPMGTTCKPTAEGVDHLITYVGPDGVTDSWVTQTSPFDATDRDRGLGRIKVKPQTYVHGHVQGASLATVEVRRLNGTTAMRTRTDAEGNYRFQGLAPGRYRVGGGGNGALPWQSRVVELKVGRDSEVNGVLREGASLGGVLRSVGERVAYIDVLLKNGKDQH